MRARCTRCGEVENGPIMKLHLIYLCPIRPRYSFDNPYPALTHRTALHMVVVFELWIYSHYEVMIVMGFFSSRKVEQLETDLHDDNTVVRVIRSRFVRSITLTLFRWRSDMCIQVWQGKGQTALGHGRRRILLSFTAVSLFFLRSFWS